MRDAAVVAVVAVAGAVVSLAGPAPAVLPGIGSAPAVDLTDGRGDLWVIGPGEDDWGPFGHRRPTVDVVGASAQLGGTALTASLAFADLRPGHTQDFSLRVRSDRALRRAIVSVDPAHPGGRDRLLDRSETVLTCPGLHHRVDYDADTVRIVLPTSCVDEPGWVRVALATYLFREWDTIADNPHNDGPEPSFTGRLYVAPGEPMGQRGRPSAAAQPGQAP